MIVLTRAREARAKGTDPVGRGCGPAGSPAAQRKSLEGTVLAKSAETERVGGGGAAAGRFRRDSGLISA
jgi:hypothetical protein